MDFRLPTLGEGADSGTVVNILVKEGENIAKGQTVIELETGKAVTPIPSSLTGQITKILVKEGQKVSVGAPIISVAGGAGETAEAPATTPKKTAAPKAPAKKAAAAEPEETEVEEAEEEFEYTGANPPPASPSLRRLAQDLGIDLRKIRGSEGGGRIILSDLKAYISNLQKLAKKAQAPAAATPGAKPKPVAEQIDFSRFGSIYKRPMTPLRKVIAQRMAENWNAIPHVTQFDNIDLTNLMSVRKKFVEAYEKKGAKLTVTALSLKAVINALKKHPIFNSSLDEVSEEIVFKEYFNIGIAVDTDQGLIVPVIRNADKKSVFDLAKELAELAEKTRDRKVSMEDLQGGTFTISNQGAFGGAHFTPIVNKPEVAILGMGKGALQPVVTKDGKIEARTVLPVGLSYDHRVIDGGSAARFMVDLVNEFQNFNEAEVKI
jgi:pyruvate dehydrogenase E2 component (dihydrolipoamide acetyltransferase)